MYGWVRKLAASKHQILYRESLQNFEAQGSSNRGRDALMQVVRCRAGGIAKVKVVGAGQRRAAEALSSWA